MDNAAVMSHEKHGLGWLTRAAEVIRLLRWLRQRKRADNEGHTETLIDNVRQRQLGLAR